MTPLHTIESVIAHSTLAWSPKRMSRIRVPGGWLYVIEVNESSFAREGQTRAYNVIKTVFVPDPEAP